MIKNIIEKQREYFLSGNTLNINKRIDTLKKLKEEIFNHYDMIIEAFNKDFNKCEFDVVTTEISMVISEIDYFIKNLKKLSKPKKVKGNLINFPSKGYIIPEPYGVCLIMSPWNYPLQLSLLPLVGAIASGNTVVLKPSNYAKNVSEVLKTILMNFDNNYINVVLGGREVNQDLLEQKFDYIFFTGSVAVGKLVMEKASKYLTEVTLELGGKSPCIVDEKCNLDLACKRIVWGKYLNAGQTCVAPDYILVNKNIHDEFVQRVKEYISIYYYQNNHLSKDFPQIINDKHLTRLTGLINYKKVVFGGNIKGRVIEPTVMDNVTYSDNIMKEEIFGPIMPIIEYDNIDNVIYELQRLSKPLALYIFSERKDVINKVLTKTSSGGACVNDCIMHLTNDALPFGGVGESGMGSYHGLKSFETFSHYKSVFEKGKMEINLKYPPYSEKKLKTAKKILKVK